MSIQPINLGPFHEYVNKKNEYSVIRPKVDILKAIAMDNNKDSSLTLEEFEQYYNKREINPPLDEYFEMYNESEWLKNELETFKSWKTTSKNLCIIFLQALNNPFVDFPSRSGLDFCGGSDYFNAAYKILEKARTSDEGFEKFTQFISNNKFEPQTLSYLLSRCMDPDFEDIVTTHPEILDKIKDLPPEIQPPLVEKALGITVPRVELQAVGLIAAVEQKHRDNLYAKALNIQIKWIQSLVIVNINAFGTDKGALYIRALNSIHTEVQDLALLHISSLLPTLPIAEKNRLIAQLRAIKDGYLAQRIQEQFTF